MSENVVSVEALVSTKGNADTVVISKEELNRLKRERDEYREMCLDFAESVPRFHEVADNIEAILAKKDGGIIIE